MSSEGAATHIRWLQRDRDGGAQGDRARGDRARGDRARDRPATWEAPDVRRWLQLGLAAIWLLDGVLQYQPFMFTRAFGQMLAASAAGNPAVIADPITWAAGIVQHNPTTTNAAFATIQLALGLGIAWRRTLRVALAASIVWSVAVWWLGEGLGGVLFGGASPLSGAPGAVILYALLAVLLWPAGAGRPANDARPPRFVAAGPLGVSAARVLWLVLWGSLAYFCVTAVNRTGQGLHDAVAGMAADEPGWMASINRGAASVLAHRGLPVSIVLAVVLAVIAIGIFLSAPAARVTIVLAVVVSALIWIVAQDLGELLARGATDPNSGPLLILVALAYWPLGSQRAGPAAVQTAVVQAAADEAAVGQVAVDQVAMEVAGRTAR
jgi:hypothetical protein